MTTATLLIKDGPAFHGNLIGASGCGVGELVFNTAMTGYQEILTDPSYADQIVTLTYPHIGNTGTNEEDCESDKIYAKGLVVRDLPHHLSSWRSRTSLDKYLKQQQVVAIANIDTRQVTRFLREHGAHNAAIFSGDVPVAKAQQELESFAGLQAADLASVVSVTKSYEWDQGLWQMSSDSFQADKKFFVVAYDFGIKRNILRYLVTAGCRVKVVPARTSAKEVLALNPDGVFLSNGPGDPEPCTYAIDAIAHFLDLEIPLFGICLGHQLLSLACGAKTIKMKFGHHGANHPVLDLASGQVLITSQNHGFCVDEATLPASLQPTHRSLFDDTLQGVRHTQAPAFSFQGHPEASPGPHDILILFRKFVDLMKAYV